MLAVPVPALVLARVALELVLGCSLMGFAEITLDGCSGEGGGARGLVAAGHYVVGVDINPACRDGYLRSGAHEFICADILDVLADPSFMSRFTYTTFHGPCQPYSTMSACRPEIRDRYPRLIRPAQPLLDALGIPFTIENVEGARSELRDPVTLCMWMFGRETYRHRLVESGGGLVLRRPFPEPWAWRDVVLPRFGKQCGWPHPVATARAGHWQPGMFVSVAGHERKEPVRKVMEIDWMSSRDAVKEAIPPYMMTWVAAQLAGWRKAGQETAA
jgi:DNA (cytosine-5)-methyltransferase 1